MKSSCSLIDILLSNTWQENFNTWTFQDSVILIKNYSNPSSTKLVPFSIEENDGGFLLRTRREDLGVLYVRLKNEAPIPKITLQSATNSDKSFILEAFTTFSEEQKLIIDAQIKKVKEALRQKQSEINSKIIDLKKDRPNDRMSLILDPEASLQKIQQNISLLEGIIKSTVNIASNFDLYLANVTHDADKLLSEINEVHV